MLLPHGYEGRARDSSARLERYLQLCAEHNVGLYARNAGAGVPYVAPASDQAIAEAADCDVTQKPVAPRRPCLPLKNWLRDRSAVLDGADGLDPNKVKRIILCSGKVYYDLRAARRDRGIEDIALLRIEQLYPFPEQDLERWSVPES